MLAGMCDMGDSMFPTIGNQPSMMPDAADMEQAAAMAGQQRTVDLDKVCVDTYDLSEPRDVKRYTRDIEAIMLGTPAHTHMLLAREPLKFVDTGGVPRYIAHLQWVEFKLNKVELKTQPVGAGKPEENANG